MNMANDYSITVFTPTYNRAGYLQRCYESLKRQTCKNFLWLIIDDGSTDNTGDVVRGWIAENTVPIRYYRQDNQGMHAAHNTAYSLIDTELNVCIDSDDYMADNAIEKILSFWGRNKAVEYSGIISLNADKEGRIIGTGIPDEHNAHTISELYQKMGMKGDKKLIYRTDVMRRYPDYPVFKGEKYFPTIYKHILADQDYKMLVMNHVTCIVEYLPDGVSLNILRLYRLNPNGFLFLRKVMMKYALTFRRRFLECVHYVSSSIMLKNRGFLKESPRKLLTLLAIPFGVVLYAYVMRNSQACCEQDEDRKK